MLTIIAPEYVKFSIADLKSMHQQDDFSFCLSFCRDIRLLILEHERWSLTQKYQTLMKDGITIEALMSFVKNLKCNLFVEGLVQGNFTSKVNVLAQNC